jgi:CubicO group peptidase (beta-lactamase class C family)
MAIILLVAKRQLAFNERLTDIFPEFPAYGKTITVRQLLFHTSGLLDYEALIPNGTQIPVRDRDVLHLLMEQSTTYFAPGSRFRYSNSAYALLALAVESRSGLTFAHFLRHYIFGPLGMHNTLAYEPGLSIVPNRAFGYSANGKRFKRTDQSLTSSVLGDGGIYSSVADLYRWDQALYTDELVSRSMLREAFNPAVQTDLPHTGYAMGWFVGRYRGMQELWHHGETIGFRTRIARFSQRRFTVIILANRTEAQLDQLPHRIADTHFGPRH